MHAGEVPTICVLGWRQYSERQVYLPRAALPA